jgi:mannose-6-phosphate isomerase-like protein (cupin superfamily)
MSADRRKDVKVNAAQALDINPAAVRHSQRGNARTAQSALFPAARFRVFRMLHLALAESLSRLTRDNTDFVRLLAQDDFDLSLYRPTEPDTQTPHARDEIYVVATGSGTFICEAERSAFRAGDAIFVAAGKPHRFEAFTPDFSVWVIFIGPRP